MRFIAGIILLVAICEATFNQTHELLKFSESDPEYEYVQSILREKRLAGSTGAALPYTSYPWFNIIHDHNKNKDISHGVFYNQYWVLSTTTALSEYEGNTGNLVVFFGMTDRSDTTNAKSRMVNQVITHADVDGSINDIALARICPKFVSSSYAQIPNSPIVYVTGSEVTLLAYDKDLSSAKKKVGEKCECRDTYPEEYNIILHICLEEHPSVYVDANDIPGVTVLQDGKVVGMVALRQKTTGGGEVGIDFSEYNSWITQHAVY